jgi:CBS domain-containing protein
MIVLGMAATDPVAWVRTTPPFASLPPALFDAAAKSIDVSSHSAGTWLVRAGGAPLEHLYVIRKGSVRLERNNQTLRVLRDGEIFGYTSLLTGEATLDVVVDEDLIAHRLPAADFRRLMLDPGFARHFASEVAERLQSSHEQTQVPLLQPDLSLAVQHLICRPPVWVEPETAVGAAARRMRDEGVSSVLVRTNPPGIVTDRDFRNRVLAAGLDAERPVTQIISRPLRTVPANTPVYEAWRILLDADVHHLPVTRGEGIVGVVTATDLLRHSAHGPLSVLWRVKRMSSRKGLAGHDTRVAEMIAALLAGGLDASVIAGFVARVNDALLDRILRWAEDDLGQPPAPYAWIAFGSEGRMEQTLLTDQDNALLYADEGAAHGEWFQRFADRVNADLEAAGFPPCSGGYMARHWHGPLSNWLERFNGWINVPSRQALLVASIFFDFRKVGGDLDLEPLHAVLAGAAQKQIFLRWLATDALDFRTPNLLALRFRGRASTVNLKRNGISPVVSLARCYALGQGIRARNTIDRLRTAARALSEQWEGVIEAYRFLLGIRVRYQLRLMAQAKPISNHVVLGELSTIERRRLRISLGAIRDWQVGALHYFGTEY